MSGLMAVLEWFSSSSIAIENMSLISSNNCICYFIQNISRVLWS